MAYTAWVDFIVHKLIPVVVVADWLIDPPQHLVGNRRVPRSN